MMQKKKQEKALQQRQQMDNQLTQINQLRILKIRFHQVLLLQLLSKKLISISEQFLKVSM